MGNLRETAKAFVPQKNLTVADLEVLSSDVPIQERMGKDKNGKEFHYKVAIVMGEEYRVPSSVLEEIQTIMESKPSLKTIKVVKKGTGMSTSYTVVAME
jgi:hypothetical protein